jgi:hypothetical protein
VSRILFVTSVFRVGERVYPAITKLSKLVTVDVLFNAQMSPQTSWHGDIDLRQPWYKEWGDLHTFSTPRWDDGRLSSLSLSKLCSGAILEDYDLVIFDDNKLSTRFSTDRLFRAAYGLQKNIIMCPHGNVDYQHHRATKMKQSSHCFVFGEKDRCHVGCETKAVGMPANDVLYHYPLRGHYGLVILNLFSESKPHIRDLRCMSRSLLKQWKLGHIADSLGVELVIKCKSRVWSSAQRRGDYDCLKSLPNTRIVLDVDDDNKLIADAKFVVSAPSTLAYKSIQLGVPTVLLSGFGQSGGLSDFSGMLHDPTYKSIRAELERQTSLGRQTEFIANALEGGVNFNSTDVFVKEVLSLL